LIVLKLRTSNLLNNDKRRSWMMCFSELGIIGNHFSISLTLTLRPMFDRTELVHRSAKEQRGPSPLAVTTQRCRFRRT
jgi:hypothetical protein